MSEIKLGAIESRFADIVWENEPISTAELVKICAKELSWKRTTTYTVLKRLSERGFFQNIDSIVTSIISRNEFYSLQSKQFVDETFGGSLPAFIAAFTAKKDISKEDLEEVRKMIDQYGEGKL